MFRKIIKYVSSVFILIATCMVPLFIFEYSMPLKILSLLVILLLNVVGILVKKELGMKYFGMVD
uniref:Uncharacterized protein n=1 Tax=Enterococcus faecium TaxID=1352 RepID=O85792_ENTFC|nr:unknown [Enterococcus faecium]AAD28236.1 unknown [Enterococcus faecium]